MAPTVNVFIYIISTLSFAVFTFKEGGVIYTQGISDEVVKSMADGAPSIFLLQIGSVRIPSQSLALQ